MARLPSEHKELSKIFTKLHKKMKLPIKDFFSKYDQVCIFLWIWSHLQRKSLMKNFLCSASGRILRDGNENQC